MTAISTSDLNKLRGQVSRITAQLNIWERRVVATAKINQTTFSYPLAELTVNTTSSGWSDILPGMLYEIYDSGGELITTGIARKAPTATTFYTLAMSAGSTGRAQAIARPLANGDDIVVYDSFPFFAVYSRIADGVFYKAWDRAYVDEGSNPPPVCNMGAPRALRLANGATTASVTLSAAASFAWGTKTITAYQWVVPPAFNLTAGSLTSASITGTLPAGFYLFRCTVTDSGGKTQFGIRPVWVNPYGYESPFGAAQFSGSGRQDLASREESFTIYDSDVIDQDALYDGAAVLLSVYGDYTSGALSDGVLTSPYFGFIESVSRKGSYKATPLTIATRGVMGTLAKVGAVPQALVASASPSNWTEVDFAFAEPSFVAWYILAWHCPNALRLCDFHRLPDTSPPRKRNYAVNADTIAGQLEEVAKLVLGNIGSASDGSLHFLRNPNMEPAAFRNSLPTRIVHQPDDIQKEIEQTQSYMPTYGQATLYGFASTSASVIPLGAIAHYAQGQGGSKQSGETILVGDQDELNQKVGDYLASLNAPPDMTINLMRQFDVHDPARHYNAWTELNIPADYDARGIGYAGRGIVKAVNRSWRMENGSLLCDLGVTWSPETDGQDGITLPSQRGAAPPPTPTFTPPERVYAPVIVWNDNAALARSTDFPSNYPTWTDIKGAMVGTVNDVAIRTLPRAPFGQQTARPLPAWAVTVQGTTLRIYHTENINAGTVRWTQQASYTMSDSTVTTSARIAASRIAPDTVYAAWRTQTGTFVVRTTDGGVTWSASPTVVGSTAPDTANDNAPIGLCIEGAHVYVTARALGKYIPFVAQASLGTFTAVTGGANYPADKPNALIVGGGDGSILVSVDGDPITETRTFKPAVFTPTHTMSAVSAVRTPTGFALGASCGSFTAGEMALVPVTSPAGNYPIVLDLLFKIDGGFSQPVDVTALTMTVSPKVFYWYQIVNFEYGYELRDINNTVLSSNTYAQTWIVPGNTFVAYCETYTQSPTLSVAGAYYARFFVKTTSDWVKPLTPANAQLYLQLVDAAVTGTWTFAPRGLYRITSPSTTGAVWSSKTPAVNFIPKHKYALSMDVRAGTFSVLANNGSVFRLYRTTNGTSPTTTYTTVLASGATYDGLVRGGAKTILFGNNALEYSPDYGLTQTDKRGNWTSAIGALGRVLGVIAWL